MPRNTSTFELILPERKPESPAYRWLYSSLRAAILNGRLRPGTQLPASRELAVQYGVSRGTIVRAFEELKSEGYLDGSMGSGTYVSKVLPEDLFQAWRASESRTGSYSARRPHFSTYGNRVQAFPFFGQQSIRAFRANLPALDLFPTQLWAQIAARRWRSASTAFLSACEPFGYYPLRIAISDYLNASRGVKCIPAQVAVVSGAQEAIDLAARLLLNPGDRVCMETPGYIGAELVFRAIGAKVVHAEVDGEGAILRSSAMNRTRLVYITPGRQYPLGVVMSLARRLALLEQAKQHGTFIFEDDYDSEYRYSGRPLPSLQGLDRYQSVIFAGSFSKVLFPSLRLGYLVLPETLIDRLAATVSITSRHAPLPEQAILCDFITEGHFGRHLRRMRHIYAERAAVLSAAARSELAGLLEIPPIEAGLQTVGWLCNGLKGTVTSRAAANRDVELIPFGTFTCGRTSREGVQLGFAALNQHEIQRGVEQLAIAIRQVRKNSGKSPSN